MSALSYLLPFPLGCLLIACGAWAQSPIPAPRGDADDAGGEPDAGTREAVSVRIRGMLETGQMAIGGETTGTVVRAKGMTFELAVPREGRIRERIDLLDGQRVLVTGELNALQTPERGRRWLVDLQSIEPAAGQETQAIDLKMSALKWKRRPLLIFTPGESAEAFRQQTARLGELRSQIQERDMAVIQVVADQGGSVDGRPLTEAAVDRLRAAYQVAPDEFAVILVGKDATVKLRHEQPVAWRQIFRLIDSMPMRQREMRR